VRIGFHPEALEEFKDAAQYYAGRQEYLELRFIAAVETVLKRIQQNPEWARIFEDDIRRSLIHVFPYAVLYSIEPDYLLIIAVMHCNREPGYWRHRVKPKT
jgi:toxin ParE1/3/4